MEFAGNPITPSEVLAKLANGEYQDKDVLLGVASNPATPKENFTVLSNGEDARSGTRLMHAAMSIMGGS